MPERLVPLFRLLWFLCFVLSVAAVALGTVHAVRETYQIHPVFRALALDYDLKDDGQITIKAQSKPHSTFSLLAIDGIPVDPYIRIPALAHRLKTAPGPTVTLDVQAENGTSLQLHQVRNVKPEDPQASHSRDIRFGARLTSGLLACGVLLFCSVLLARRRPSDPVALLFAFAFVGLASTIDPPLAMWMAYGWPPAYDVDSSLWFYLLLIALAVFPDGIFVPKYYRWLVIAGVPLAIFLSLHDVNTDLQALLGFGSLLAVVAAQVLRYRRLGPGIERQQIKWAAFGFAAGLILSGLAFVLLPFLPDGANEQKHASQPDGRPAVQPRHGRAAARPSYRPYSLPAVGS